MDVETLDQTTDTDLDLTAQDDQQASESADQSESTDTQGQQQTETEKVDGRRFNPEWSKALKELRELYPDRADMLTKLRDNYARYQALQEVAPKGLDDVRAWKSTIDAVGGPEAAAELMRRAADMDAVDERIANADYTVIGELPENLQKGFYQMLPDALNDLSERDPQLFQAAVAPHFQAALAGTGLGEVIDGQVAGLKELFDRVTDPEAKALIRQLFGETVKAQNWYKQQTSGAGAFPNGKKAVSPEVQRLQAELETRRKADDESFIASSTNEMYQSLGSAFDREAAVYLKQLNLTDAQKSDLMESFESKMADKLARDAAFQKQLAAYKSLKNRNPETINSYIRGKIDENAKSILDALVTARYGGMRQKAAPASTGTTTTSGGATRVSQAPDQSQWDMPKMEALGYEATVKKGLFYLQGGRTVQLVRS